jgi:polypeptide N-acetylgalactosaminyltransferase
MSVGGFDWKLTYNWHVEPEKEKQRKSNAWEPTRSPAMAGGLFSMDKAYFERLGSYDRGMDIWGAENIEMSIRIWTCGGNMEIIPCSKVGHIFRKVSPYKWRAGKNVARINTIRVVEVWLDDYKKYYYARNGPHKNNFGDISERVKLRKDLGCKSFQWYLNEVFPELKPPDNMIGFGEVS